MEDYDVWMMAAFCGLALGGLIADRFKFSPCAVGLLAGSSYMLAVYQFSRWVL